MARHHLIQVSDLHISSSKHYNHAGWEACLRHINQARPDFVAVTGDLVLDNPDVENDHRFAREQLDRLATDWAALPGNHDIGDTNPAPYQGQHFIEERLARYKRNFGADYWWRDIGNWRLIGLNALLPGSGLTLEAEQDDWLKETILQASGRPIALFIHKPLCIDRLDESSRPDSCVIGTGRDKLLDILSGANIRFIASGHNHHYRTFTTGDLHMIWAPSTSQVFDMPRPFVGLAMPGLVNIWLDDDNDFEYGLVRPDGMAVNNVTRMIGQYGAMRNTPDYQWDAGRNSDMGKAAATVSEQFSPAR